MTRDARSKVPFFPSVSLVSPFLSLYFSHFLHILRFSPGFSLAFVSFSAVSFRHFARSPAHARSACRSRSVGRSVQVGRHGGERSAPQEKKSKEKKEPTREQEEGK